MVELIVLLILIVIAVCIKIHRTTRRLAARERDYIEEQRMFHHTGVCRIYGALKLALILIVTLATGYIFVSLAAGEVIGLHRLTDAEFWKTAGGCAVILLPKLWFLRLLRKQAAACRNGGQDSST